MAYEAFPLNLKLTEEGYQRVFHGFGAPVNIKYIALGSAGYSVAFRDTATALRAEVTRKQIDSSQIVDTIDATTGNPCKRVDYATIFSLNITLDVREVGFFSDDGVLIYVWSSNSSEAFAPIRPQLSLVVSIAQYLLIQEEMAVINVVDAGYPIELFIQPLIDQMTIDKQAITNDVYSAAYERLRTAFYATICNVTAAPIHEDGECLEIPLNESTIINLETGIVAKPIL